MFLMLKGEQAAADQRLAEFVSKITGFKSVIFDGIGRLMKNRAPILFEDVEKAKDWLVDNK